MLFNPLTEITTDRDKKFLIRRTIDERYKDKKRFFKNGFCKGNENNVDNQFSYKDIKLK